MKVISAIIYISMSVCSLRNPVYILHVRWVSVQMSYIAGAKLPRELVVHRALNCYCVSRQAEDFRGAREGVGRRNGRAPCWTERIHGPRFL